MLARRGPATAAPFANGLPPAQPRPSLLGDMHDGAWLDGQDFPALNYHVHGLVPEGLTVLTGAPKVGKSWLVLGWALDLAAAGRTVVYLALEDSYRRVQARCRVSLAGQSMPAGFRFITRVPPGAITAAITEIMAAYGAGRPLVILDTLGKVMPPAANGETTYARDYRVMSELKAITDGCPGSGLLVCHHDRKAGSADFIDVVSGTRGITGGADTVLLLTRPRSEAAGVLAITGRDVDEDEYAVTLAAGRWTLDGRSLPAAAAALRVRRAQAGLGDRSADVIAFVTASGESGVRAADVAASVGIDEDQAKVYLKRLCDRGRIRRAARGLYASVSSVISPAPPRGGSNTNNGTNSTSRVSRRAAAPGAAVIPPGPHWDAITRSYVPDDAPPAAAPAMNDRSPGTTPEETAATLHLLTVRAEDCTDPGCPGHGRA